MTNRRRDNTVFDEIRRALVEHWDPLNVAENPNLWDEYDSYIPVVFAALRKEVVAKEEIYDELAKLEQELGVKLSPDRREEAVKSLLALNVHGR